MGYDSRLAFSILCQRTIQLANATLEWDRARAEYLSTNPYDSRNSGTHERSPIMVDIRRTDPKLVSNVIAEAKCAPNPYPGGYGAKVPSRYKLKYNGGRLRRVWFAVYGNTGSAYIIDQGEDLFLDIDTEHALEAARELTDSEATP